MATGVVFPTFAQLNAITATGQAFLWRPGLFDIPPNVYALTVAQGQGLFGGDSPHLAIPVRIGRPRRIIPMAQGGAP
jgi:hypothetical protein